MSIKINKIPGFKSEMVILKVYLYEKTWKTGVKTYLTLFSLIPKEEYKPKISLGKSSEQMRPATGGSYVHFIGSASGIIPTTNRVNLTFYQRMLEGAGWKFRQTIPGMKGEDFEFARRTAFAEIQRRKKGGNTAEDNMSHKITAINLMDRLERDIYETQCTQLPSQSCDTCSEREECMALRYVSYIADMKAELLSIKL